MRRYRVSDRAHAQRTYAPLIILMAIVLVLIGLVLSLKTQLDTLSSEFATYQEQQSYCWSAEGDIVEGLKYDLQQLKSQMETYNMLWDEVEYVEHSE